MSLPQFSPKRIREIQAGKRNTNGSLKVSVKDLREKQDAKTKAIREAIYGTPKKGKSDRAKWKAMADKFFSEFIRLRDSDANGIAMCITSGRRIFWRKMDAGHYITRAREATRYDEQNAHAQSKQANRFQGGHFVEHGDAIDQRYGAGTAVALRIKSGQACKRTAQDYRFLAETYQKRVFFIREQEPDRYFGTPAVV